MNRKMILFMITTLLISCQNQVKEKVSVDPPEVTTTVVRKQQVAIPVEVAGRVSARDEAKLSFKKGGVIEEVTVQEGQFVKEGQVLARLKQTEFTAARAQAELAMEKAQRDFDRVSNLYHDSVATLEQYQNAQTALGMAKQSLNGLLFNVELTTIRAPTDGRILRKLASADEIIGEGIPVILFGSTKSRWVLNTSVADRDVVQLTVGDSAVVRMDPWPDRDFYATISEISGMADPYTGTFDIELMFEGDDSDLWAGIIGKAQVYPSGKSYYWLIPAGALIEGSGRQADVYRVSDGKAELLTIPVAAVRRDKIFSAGPLPDSLEIIITGQQVVSDGMTVRTASNR